MAGERVVDLFFGVGHVAAVGDLEVEVAEFAVIELELG